MATHLHSIDLAIVALYLIGITLFGLRFAKGRGKEKSLKSYFLADNTIPWWAISLSIVSAETSTLTIISIPGVAFAGDFGFLQIVLGYMLGRIVVAGLFLPRYFAGEMLTAYQLIDQRFGPTLHKVTAGLFLLTRAAAEGVRIFAVSIVVGIAIGTGDILSIAIISALTLLYTFEGGMAAVIWTDVIQMAIYIGGTFIAVWSLGHHVPDGWTTIHTVASAAGKFHLFNFALNLTTTYTFWAGVLGGTFLTMASHGTDQLMVQRMLAARSLRESRLALLSSGVVIFMQFALFLLIGVGLYVFYGNLSENISGAPFMAQSHRAMGGVANAISTHAIPAGLSPDRIFPTFIVHELPIGIAGLLVAAILAAAMSNLSAALNSLSSTTVVDFYMQLRPMAEARERNLISKSSTVLWAIVLFAIAIYSLSVGGKGHVVEIGLSIASVAYGCLLGVFLLGTLTRFATEIGTAIGMVCGFIVNIAIWQFPGKILWQAVSLDRNGINRSPMPPITIPHIAYTWYVLIGALVTFLIGALASLLFRKQSRRTTVVTTTAASLLLLFFLPFRGAAEEPASPAPAQTTAPDFTPITTLLTDAIAAHHLPGAVVLIGHNGHVVFHHAYGNRKLANEPGLDGQPSPAEPMTEDTLFDMASLTKDLATATAVMQLYEAGKIESFDDPISKYLPEFLATPSSSATDKKGQRPDSYQPGAKPQVTPPDNAQRAEGPAHSPATDPRRALVTIRMLLTHTSGEAPDISLKDPWGLAAPDRAEGFHRALTSPLKDAPGSLFTYSDINFILLGALVEQLSGEREDIYVREHIFDPLRMMSTDYRPFPCDCNKPFPAPYGHPYPSTVKPLDPNTVEICTSNTCVQPNLAKVAPTAHDDESKSDPSLNPDFDHLLRGTVHDPTTRRMGGVAGHAGVFSTAHDISLYASALLEKLTHDTGPFPLKQSTLRLMTQPEQPGHNPSQIPAAQAANDAAIKAGDKPAEPGLAPHYPAIKGESLRGFGWDIDTAFSKPRGAIFPIGSFGHTGFTGTSLWMDPASDTYVILLANAIHPRGNPPISNLRGEVATVAALALFPAKTTASIKDVSSRPERSAVERPASGTSDTPCAGADCVTESTQPPTLTGIDVLESTHFSDLAWTMSKHKHGGLQEAHPFCQCRFGLLTNQAGLDKKGQRTIDVLYRSRDLYADDARLTTLFTPEHGLSATQDTEHLTAETDATTHLPILSLYGSKPADRHPTHDQLKDLDAVVIDLQDAGVHFWTYEAAAAYFLEAAALEQSQYHHDLEIIVLDRPNPIGGLAVQGPVSDPGTESYVNYMPLPVRHGLTLGELLRYANAEKDLPYKAPPQTVGPGGVHATHTPPLMVDEDGPKAGIARHPDGTPVHGIHAHLTVIPMQNWQRSQFYASTGLPWVNPSPNLRSPEAALRYPALGLIEYANISVGRGSVSPFSFFGAGVAPAKLANGHPDPKTNIETVITPPGTPSSGYTVQLGGSGAPQTTTPSHTYTVGTRITHDSQTTSATVGWFNAEKVADALNARNIPGVTFAATKVPIANDANNYPFHGQTIEAVKLTLTDPVLADTPEIGIEILSVLHKLYPTQFNLDRDMGLVCNRATLDAIKRDEDPRSIAASWQPALDAFRQATLPYRLYP